jgi:hypothetical protein
MLGNYRDRFAELGIVMRRVQFMSAGRQHGDGIAEARLDLITFFLYAWHLGDRIDDFTGARRPTDIDRLTPISGSATTSA